MRHPLYSVPPPPRPNYDGCTTIDERAEAQQACFPAALDWMLVNYAYYTDAFMGKGGIISLVDGKISNDRQPARLHAALHDRGRRPAGRAQEDVRRRCLDDASAAAHIDAVQTRPDKPRPTFTEDGLIVYQPLLAAGASDERRRDRDVQDLFRAAGSRRRGTGMVLALACATRRASRGCRWSRSSWWRRNSGPAAGRCLTSSDCCSAKTTSCRARSAS